MEHSELKRIFLSKFSDDVTSMMLPEHYDILDEAIEKIIEGKTNVNGRAPKSEDEIVLVLGQSLIVGVKAFEGIKTTVEQHLKEVKEKTIVNITYRGKTFSFEN